MKIYGHWASGCTQKVFLTLAEKRQVATLVSVDIINGEQQRPEYLELHPFGLVPVMYDDDFVLYESRAIIRYIEEKFDGPRLVPKSLQERARMAQWMSFEQCYFSPQVLALVRQVLWSSSPDAAAVEDARSAIAYALGVADRHLASAAHFAGDDFSLADITWIPYMAYLHDAGNDLIVGAPHVARWWAAAQARSTWRQVIALRDASH